MSSYIITVKDTIGTYDFHVEASTEEEAIENYKIKIAKYSPGFEITRVTLIDDD